MRTYEAKVNCKCGAEQKIRFTAKCYFKPRSSRMKCTACDSDIFVSIKQALVRHKGMWQQRLATHVKLIKHTEKLLNLLKEREANAQDYA